MNQTRAHLILLCFVLVASLGCQKPSGATSSSTATPSQPATSSVVAGTVGNSGGRPPIANAVVQFYEVGTAGDASPAKPLLSTPLTSDQSGYFQTAPNFSCNAPSDLVYVAATGTYPGITSKAANPNLAFMALVGRCDSLVPGNFLQVNDVSTVVAVATLSPFIASTTLVGSASTDQNLLQASFNLNPILYSLGSGYSPGTNVPTNDTVPRETIDLVGDILFACTSTSGGVAGDGSPCGNLFAFTTLAGAPAPTNTVAALIGLFANPANNVAQLFGLLPAPGPYQPSLSVAPSSLSVQLAEPTSLSFTPSAGIDSSSAVGSTSSAQSITLLNNNASSVVVGPITLGGTAASDFTFTSSCDSALAQGQSCFVTVTFSPSSRGLRLAFLQIGRNGSSFPQMIPLRGVGT
jgi:hypothetical protein